MLKAFSIACWMFAACSSAAHGQEYKISEIDGGPADDSFAAEFAKDFSRNGVKVTLGSSRTLCEIWLCERLDVTPGFEESEVLLYPLREGQLVGLIHFPRRSRDFRGQTIQRGWYTLRFALQPIDGNHVGTSPTRDFLLMVQAEQDDVKKEWDVKDLHAASAAAAGSSHPAMICLQRVDKLAEKTTALRHDEENDWWILRLVGAGSADGKSHDVAFELVVAGQAAE